MFYSPLRYPGGKNKLAKFIAEICVDNNINGHYVEPYAGGASVALYLLLEKKVSKITINDLDRSIYAFWYSVLNYTKEFCSLIEKTEINVDNWRWLREVQKNKQKASLLELGLSTFFLNRVNRSGIINAGVIGGVKQAGKYKIDCRFNKEELIKKIRNIAKNKKNINLCNLDALKLIEKIKNESNNSQTIFYFDPPYYLKGSSLYVNHYDHGNHEEVSEEIKKIKNIHWIVSYDDVPEINKMYDGCIVKKYSFFHSAHKSKLGDEVLFFSDNLYIPSIVNPTKV